MIPLGSKAPDFSLPDVVKGLSRSLQQMKGEKATLIAFICNHCPFVKHINPQLVRLANEYSTKGVSVIAISSNDIVQYPEDGPESMKMVAKKLGYTFPYLYDESQEVAKAYNAVCTPDFFIYDSGLRLIYRGQLDDSRPGNEIPVSGKDIRTALGATIKGEPVPSFQKPSIGCNIKWKSE
jgi:peroxiredoxin